MLDTVVVLVAAVTIVLPSRLLTLVFSRQALGERIPAVVVVASAFCGPEMRQSKQFWTEGKGTFVKKKEKKVFLKLAYIFSEH